MTDTEQQELEQELAELDSTLTQLRHEDAGRSDELTQLSQHPADVASDIVDRERQEAVMRVLMDKRERVVARLGEIGAGSGAA